MVSKVNGGYPKSCMVENHGIAISKWIIYHEGYHHTNHAMIFGEVVNDSEKCPRIIDFLAPP